MKKVFYASMLAAVLILAACDTGETPAPTPTPDPANPPTTPQNKVQSLPVYENLTTSQGLNTQGEDGYNITLEIVGNPSDQVVAALETAAARWEGIIQNDLPDIAGSLEADQCGNETAFNGNIDDVVIFAGTADIDGPNGILAQAGPCLIRTSNGLTTTGQIIFDAADIDSNPELDDIAIHEMGHVLGIGTLWELFGLLFGAGTDDPQFFGSQTMAEYSNLGGFGLVPVEGTGGPGTADAHWRETVFDNELMTGFINDGENPLSRLTIASLGDLGYEVNLDAADDYSLPDGSGFFPLAQAQKYESVLIKPFARVE